MAKGLAGQSSVPRGRAPLIALFAVAVIATSAAAALLVLRHTSSPQILGIMLCAGGTFEVLGNSLRRDHPLVEMMPGLCTIAVGAVFLFGPWSAWVPGVRIIIAWLALRSLFLCLAVPAAKRSVRTWTAIAAAVDVLLAGFLFVGLSATTFAIAMFGPSQDVITSFATVMALSFIAAGVMLLEVAGDMALSGN